jgi:hypothetical protein
MRSNASLIAKIAFVGAWLGVLANIWLIGGLIGWAPEPFGLRWNHWELVYATLAAVGVASILLSLLTLNLLSSGERKWAIGGIIGGALVIVTEGLFIWLVIGALQGLRF